MKGIYKATVHSIKRAKERAGINERRAYKMIERAFERGKKAEDFSARERAYLLQESGQNTVAVAYNNYCYIFSEDGFCITMFQLPLWFGKKMYFNGKERIRNVKTYARNCVMA